MRILIITFTGNLKTPVFGFHVPSIPLNIFHKKGYRSTAIRYRNIAYNIDKIVAAIEGCCILKFCWSFRRREVTLCKAMIFEFTMLESSTLGKLSHHQEDIISEVQWKVNTTFKWSIPKKSKLLNRWCFP